MSADSLMVHAKLPLTNWFLAIHLISQAKTGLSALALKRQVGVSYPTAGLLHQKISRAMARQDGTHRLGGEVQIDDAYLGGERAGGKPGRGSENKVPFVAAVSLNEHGHPMRLKLNLVSGFTLKAICPSSNGSARCSERWRRKSEHSDKWKLCDNNPGLRPEKAERP